MSRIQKYNEVPIHFVTINIKDGIWLFNKKNYCRIVINNLKFYRDKYKLKLLSWVIIPWHIHLLLYLTEETRISDVMRDFKSFCAKQIVFELKKENRLEILEKFKIYNIDNTPFAGSAGALAPAIRKSSGAGAPELPNNQYDQQRKILNQHRTISKFQIFQEDFYDFNIYTKEKLEEKIKYIEQTNPVKHGLVAEAEIHVYQWSSFRSRWLNDNSIIEIDYLD